MKTWPPEQILMDYQLAFFIIIIIIILLLLFFVCFLFAFLWL